MKHNQEEELERTAKKARKEKPQVFKKRSHQEQFNFNKRVAELIDDKRDELRKRPVQ